MEIVSNEVISTDFTETVTDATRLWDPVAGPAGTRHAVRCPSEWSQVHYDPDEFLPWLNARTWNSEWPKYRAVDPAGVPAHPIQRS